jgi:signal transduction histidine kinase
MNSSEASNIISMEDRLFKQALYLGVSIVCFLILYDFFYTEEYHSLIIELVAGIILAVHWRYLDKKPSTPKLRYFFSFSVLILINIGWLTGAGVNMLNSSLYFISVAVVIIINDKEIYPHILTFVGLNLVLLFLAQYYFTSGPYVFFQYNEEYISDFIIAFFMIGFGSYLIIFLKLNYKNEREKLREANNLLSEQSLEITAQNEELKTSKVFLDETVETLEKQREELIEIKGSLEMKVNERTNDLLKVNKRLLTQNQQLEQYAYITSHNLRAPIARIKGLIHLLPHSENFDELTSETLNRLHESAVNLDKVFSDLSKIIKVEKGMQQPWEEINFVDEILEVVGSLKTVIAEKGIRIEKPDMKEVFIVKSLRPYVYSVLHNIIENAVKYSDPNKENPYIKILLSETANYYLVSINDNGIGINMEVANSKIFQMYQRFNDTHPGQGFGLFLVKSQMDALGGNVELESVLGQGTTFNLYFPKR